MLHFHYFCVLFLIYAYYVKTMSKHKVKKIDNNIDFWGMGVSFACAVHCLAVPFISIFSLTVDFLHNPIVEAIFILSALTIALVSFRKSWLKHGGLAPIFISMAGFSAIFYAHFCMEHELSHYITALGGILLIVSHYVNWTLIKKDSCDFICCP